MSSDLLRRAAVKLRDPLLCNWRAEEAHALAELLQHIADEVSDAGDRVEGGGLVRNEYGSIRFDWTAAMKLARVFLREPEETPDA